jgi:UDP-N-acetylglucosamine--N-acetylmuramyl-(pentapeptide) pyrophosphoryl-undecaprenol N-acetylglucosamine transferase
VSRARYAFVAGGGTAGHLQPALAIAEALVAAGHDRESIEFVGSRRGQDRATLQGRGFPYVLLPGRGIVRGFGAKDIVQNIGATIGLVVAATRAIGLTARDRPQVVISVGGYASLAASSAALLFRVPLVLVNVDAVPGAVNRLFGRFSTANIVGWPGSTLPRAIVTGTPVRPEIAGVARDPSAQSDARAQLGLPEDRPMVTVFGGSLGARRLNEAVDGLIARWKDRSDRSIFHIVGRRGWDELLENGEDPDRAGSTTQGLDAGALRLVRVPFEERMDLVYSASDLVVCRAGAMTVAELAVAGVPSVLIPLPGAPGDHQTANARVLEKAGAALLLADAECDAEALAAELDRLLDDPNRLETMGRSARALGRPDAAAAGADVVEANARPARGSNR